MNTTCIMSAIKKNSDAVVPVTSMVTNIEQIINTFSNKMPALTEMEHIFSAASLHACARSKPMLPLLQVLPALQYPGLYQDMLMAPQTQCPMAQGHLTTAGTQDADLILSQTQIMKVLEVPSYCIFLAKQCHAGAPAWLKRTLCNSRCPCSRYARQDSLHNR